MSAANSFREGTMRRLFNRTNVATTMLTIILATITFFVFRGATIRHLFRAQVLTVPFVLQRELYSVEEGPSGRLFHKQTVARRSDATMAEVSSVGPLQWWQVARTIPYTDG